MAILRQTLCVWNTGFTISRPIVELFASRHSFQLKPAIMPQVGGESLHHQKRTGSILLNLAKSG